MSLTLIGALIIAPLLGYAYGLSFVAQQRRVFYSTTHNKKRIISSIAFFILRTIILGVCITYLLRLPTIHFILTIVLFIGTFWLVILKEKASLYEGHRSSRN